MEFRLWRLLAVVAAVLFAAGHLAATCGMGAFVLISLCVRHMTAFKSLSKRDVPLVWIDRLPALALGPEEIPPSFHRSVFESFERAWKSRSNRRLLRSCNIGSAECDYGCGVAYGVTASIADPRVRSVSEPTPRLCSRFGLRTTYCLPRHTTVQAIAVGDSDRHSDPSARVTWTIRSSPRPDTWTRHGLQQTSQS
jgi:hypothetical protein